MTTNTKPQSGGMTGNVSEFDEFLQNVVDRARDEFGMIITTKEVKKHLFGCTVHSECVITAIQDVGKWKGVE